MAFIKILENNTVVGPAAEATPDMLDAGWVEYYGETYHFSKWDDDSKSVVPDTEKMNALKKLEGVEYTLNDIVYKIPLSKEAQDGVTAITLAFMNNAVPETAVVFDNGTRMPITAAEWMPFATWFAIERSKLFE